MIVGLDFETYSARSIKDGLDCYMSDPTFTVIIAVAHTKSSYGPISHRFVFHPNGLREEVARLRKVLDGNILAAQNAPFELGCLAHLGIEWSMRQTIDTAVIARAFGCDSKLELCAPQMLPGKKKLDTGKQLIKLFSIPGKFQEANGNEDFDWDIVDVHVQEFEEFFQYCEVDARLSYEIAERYPAVLTPSETRYMALTHQMNQVGWTVDMDLVDNMSTMAKENAEKARDQFYAQLQPDVPEKKRLNFNSTVQLRRFAEARGVRSKSFDEEHVAKLRARIGARIQKGGLTAEKSQDLYEIDFMLEVKQMLGGSSLSKLDTIARMTGADGQLRGQYMHCGAGQTLRTSGKGVQMQNLKRLGSEIDDVDDLLYHGRVWGNAKLARNIRQVFTASHEDGYLLVGDFASVESRGLAYEAGADWKVKAFHENKDMYKVLASQMYHVPYDEVTKQQRQTGKVGELACGYGAGGGAVQQFAAKMGVEMIEAEAAQLVYDWRQTNPEIVDLWRRLNDALLAFTATGMVQKLVIGNGLEVCLSPMEMPASLKALHQDARSMMLTVSRGDLLILRRYFHGLYMRGRDVCFWKASENYGGELWRNHYIDPNTGEVRFYKLYGGKLTGIMTQSLCRELFFQSAAMLNETLERYDNVQIIGQFHDELVVDWAPAAAGPAVSLDAAKSFMASAMSSCMLPGFPLVGEIKHDYRYTK